MWYDRASVRTLVGHRDFSERGDSLSLTSTVAGAEALFDAALPGEDSLLFEQLVGSRRDGTVTAVGIDIRVIGESGESGRFLAVDDLTAMPEPRGVALAVGALSLGAFRRRRRH